LIADSSRAAPVAVFAFCPLLCRTLYAVRFFHSLEDRLLLRVNVALGGVHVERSSYTLSRRRGPQLRVQPGATVIFQRAYALRCETPTPPVPPTAALWVADATRPDSGNPGQHLRGQGRAGSSS